MKTYIASPFFNETQVAQVKDIEDLLKSLGDEYYSPMRHGNFSELKLTNDLKTVASDLIFEDNIYQIKSSDRMIVNLNGNRDIGTLFELGVGIGLNKIINLMIDDSGAEFDPKTIQYFNVPGAKGYDKAVKVFFEMGEYVSIKSIYAFLATYDYKIIIGPKTEIVVSTLTKNSFAAGIVVLGYFYAKLNKVSYISDFKSKSNLMITKSGILQYESLDNYNKDIPIVYENKDIQ